MTKINCRNHIQSREKHNLGKDCASGTVDSVGLFRYQRTRVQIQASATFIELLYKEKKKIKKKRPQMTHFLKNVNI